MEVHRMSEVLIVDADTGSVAKRKPAQQLDVDGVDAQLVDRLVEQARTAGLQLTGEGGLLQQLTKRVLKSALEGEISDRLGYGQGRPGRQERREIPATVCAAGPC